MKVALLGCCLFVVVGQGFAHRLDEYLQATRIAVTTNRIDFTFELTPGVAVMSQILELMDPDRDGRVSGDEENAYAQRFIDDVKIGLDGKSIAPELTSVSFPTMQEIRGGAGIIRIRAASAIVPMNTGSHTLTLTNAHLPSNSVYLINALQSKDAALEIGGQSRDEMQKTYRLEFRVRRLTP